MLGNMQEKQESKEKENLPQRMVGRTTPDLSTSVKGGTYDHGFVYLRVWWHIRPPFKVHIKSSPRQADQSNEIPNTNAGRTVRITKTCSIAPSRCRHA